MRKTKPTAPSTPYRGEGENALEKPVEDLQSEKNEAKQNEKMK